jgi:hypothetical protein
MGQFSQAQQYPGQQLGILQSALGMTPYGSTTMGSQTGQSQTTQTASPMADVMGGLQSLGGMFGAGGPFASGGALAGLMTSDKHLKTDISKIGVHPPTGLPIYSYRYKGDPKSYPKVSGPMAEDAMQVAPHAVKTIGVHGPTGQAIHGVDMAALAGGPPGMGAPAGPPPLGVPAMRPQRLPMPGAGAGFAPQVPGALAPRTPTGLTGALGATMRPQRMRPKARMARVMGGMSV